MKVITTVVAIFLFFNTIAAQNFTISGTVKDKQTGETLIGANVLYEEGKGSVTNFNGEFSFQVPAGEYNVTVSYVGYKKASQKIKVTNKNITTSFFLESEVIDEVIVVADYAQQRETPVAFTNVLPAQITEELGGKDLPMVLNSTPGVYATQQGGGDGDSRINIRGFPQNFVAVMIDGIPVNDMENGWVYWSNWFGLDAITRSMQVQRGLGVSKLAIPSIGGTVNIITKGIEHKREGSVKQYVDGNGKLQTTAGYSSGVLKNGWGFTLATSYKTGSTWIEKTGTEGWFYYFKIDKRWGKHITSLTGFGAPQQHDQRKYARSIAAHDKAYAEKVGIDTFPSIIDKGIGYNYQWGYLKRDRYDPNAPREVQNEKINQYHKPQFSIRDSWTVNQNLFISNTIYLSIGKGGGIELDDSPNNNQLIQDPEADDYGQIDFQNMYDVNTKTYTTPFGVSSPIKPEFSATEYYSQYYLRKAHNEHNWYGALSTFDYNLNKNISVSGGVDLRSYTGIHYRTVHDLLGGDYTVNTDDTRLDYATDTTNAMKREGDKVGYYWNGNVRYGGAFGQVEYKTGIITSFINISTAYTGYQKEDFFAQAKSDWIWTPGFTVKGGLNYNFTERMNVFMNLGYLSKTQQFKYFFKGYSTDFSDNHDNEDIKALEVGHNFYGSKLTTSLNAYLTIWEGKATNTLTFGNEDKKEGEIPGGMNARHMGVELDFLYKLNSKLEFKGLVSLGDWIWDKKVDSLQLYDSDTHLPDTVISFDSRGIHVGDAAQTQLSGKIKYKPIKGLYLSTRITYFAKNFSQFNPEASVDENGKPKDSWRIPNYALLDFHYGYSFKFDNLDKVKFFLQGSITNVLNTTYVSDARNNDNYIQLSEFKDFDAKSAAVFFGAPRRYTLSLKVTF